ncbi:hypothetical protein NNC19_08920 [Clostridium sp. SHJSY1]|uniref:hypothetical protein n=1 Tax=Clostridium sp. SHJSY1 TaxID=2942483 RepID=UPI002874E06B|nr:hypothetical protein [Clostridium sp. SHJSY1]MDS0525798.1 hypothetical protein [Clostridium sp. SHJSY1]
MHNRESKAAIVIAILFEVILIYTGIIDIILSQWKELAQTCLAIACIPIPFILTKWANRRKILLPFNFQILAVWFITFSLYFGEIMKFYEMIWWWDLFLHGTFGAYTVIIGVYLVKGVFSKEFDATKKRFAILIAIFAFSLSIASGTLWEVFEYFGDLLLKTDMLDNGFEDTMLDLIINSIFSFITAIIYYFVTKINNRTN